MQGQFDRVVHWLVVWFDSVCALYDQYERIEQQSAKRAEASPNGSEKDVAVHG